jgi:hypothetical protein
MVRDEAANHIAQDDSLVVLMDKTNKSNGPGLKPISFPMLFRGAKAPRIRPTATATAGQPQIPFGDDN